MENQKPERLGSLDVLRGFDLFCLVFFQPVFSRLAEVMDLPFTNWLATKFEHVHWEGFVFWDLIMPLFLFMAGASMPFAFSKYLKNGGKGELYKRVLKRVLILWIFGMMCQGNLLSFNPDQIYLFSNTLQSIAIGYLIAAILLMHFRRNWQIIFTSGFLLIYWALMMFVRVGDFGGGDFTPDHNLAEYIDRVVLGRFRDRATVGETGVVFAESYRYTWILSSLNFAVTVMTGVFAGQILKGSAPKINKIKYLVLGGVCMIVAGQLWGLQMPVIKKIWTSTMTLYSSGICFLLMAFFYFLIDYKSYGKYLNWLKIYGMNSILAYMLYEIINFSSVTSSLFHGLEQYMGDYYKVLITLGNVSLILVILLLMYRKKLFLKV